MPTSKSPMTLPRRSSILLIISLVFSVMAGLATAAAANGDSSVNGEQSFTGLSKLYDLELTNFKSQIVVTTLNGVNVHTIETPSTLEDATKKLGLNIDNFRDAEGKTFPKNSIVLENNEQIILFQKKYDHKDFERITLDFPEESIETDILPKGEVDVVQDGSSGTAIRTVIYDSVTKEFSETITVITTPVAEKTLIGTGEIDVAPENINPKTIPPVWNGRLVAPLDSFVYTSGFGMRQHPVTGVYKLHDGTDLGAPCGTPVKAAAPGVVISAKYETGYGNRVIISHGNKAETSYTHLAGFDVAPGDVVRPGTQLGSVGLTGYTTGCHLHFMLRVNGEYVDPKVYIK